MKNNRIVVALGRNAFGETFPEQQKNVKKAAEAIAVCDDNLIFGFYEIGDGFCCFFVFLLVDYCPQICYNNSLRLYIIQGRTPI